MRRSPAVLLLLILLFASAYGSSQVAMEGWTRVAGFSPSHNQAPRPMTGPEPLAERLVLILVDGLRTEDALRLPALDWLSRKGARFALATTDPPYQGPMLATLLTGTEAVVHGNLVPPLNPPAVDSLPLVAVRAHISSGALGGPFLFQLVGQSVTAWYAADPSVPLFKEAAPLLAAGGPQLVILQTDQLHRESHSRKAADGNSPEYLDLLGKLDAELVQVLEQIDLSRTTVLVAGITPTAADGSHTPAAPLPLIMAGAGVRNTPPELHSAPAAVTDIAPTVSALLGMPTPLQSSGEPLWAAIAADGPAADAIAVHWLDARRLFAVAQLQAYGADLPVPAAPSTLAAAGEYVTTLDAMLSEARFSYWKSQLTGYWPYLAGGLLLLVLLMLLVYRRSLGGSLFLGTLFYVGAFHLLFYLTGGRYGTTMANLEWMDTRLLFSLLWKAAAAMAATSIFTGYRLSRRGTGRTSFLTVLALQMSLATAAAVALPVVAGLGFVIWDFPVQLASPALLVWFFVTALQVTVIGSLSPLWPLILVVANRLSQRFWPLPASPASSTDTSSGKLVRLDPNKRPPARV